MSLPVPQGGFVLVTGSTSGIGLATAIHLANLGYRVIGSGRTNAKLEQLSAAAKSANTVVHPILLDVTSEESIARARERVLEITDNHGLDGLVNNAGYGEAGAIEEIPIARLRQQFETNVIGLVAVTQAFLPEMRARHRGRIVNISSVVGKVSMPLMSAYGASKHAVEALSDGMRMELGPNGIDVVIVAPGSIESNFGQTLLSTTDWVAEDSPYKEKYARWSKQRMMNGAGRSPMLIAEAVALAVGAPAPKPRYAITIESKIVPLLVPVLPKRFLDFVLRRALM